MALSPSLTKNEWDRACGTLFATSGGMGCSSILSGTRSPIVSVAFAGSLGLHVFSDDEALLLGEIDRAGAGAMAGLSASCAHNYHNGPPASLSVARHPR
jgi:hypothetical protein